MTSIDRATLRQLAATTGPAITIVCPLDKLAPGNQHDERTLADLGRTARRQLESDVNDRGAAEAVRRNLDDAFTMLSGMAPSEGVALFAGVDRAHVVPLHMSVQPRALVSQGFGITEVVTDAARRERSRVLVLSLAKTRCIDLDGRDVCERHDAGFPVEVEAPTREETPHADFALDEHEHAEAVQFVLRAVDTAFQKVHDADPRPLVLMGAERDLSYWTRISRSPAQVLGHVHGNYEWAGTSAIAALALPVLESSRRERDHAAAAEIGEKLTNGATCGIADVWSAARSGRGHRLVVEENYHFDARLDGDGLTPATNGSCDAFDAVDDALREQIRHDGEIVVVGEGILADFGRIAVSLRY